MQLLKQVCTIAGINRGINRDSLAIFYLENFYWGITFYTAVVMRTGAFTSTKTPVLMQSWV